MKNPNLSYDDDNNPFGCLFCIAGAIFFIWLVFLFSQCATAAQVTLSWDPSTATPPTTVGGYILHYGQASGNYTSSIDVGIPGIPDSPTYTLAGLQDNVPWFFAVSAYDSARTIETTTSNEVCKPCVASPDPIADFSATPVSGVVPLSVQFTDKSTFDANTPLASWNWVFGDGTTSSVKSPSHTYTAVGIYAVGLTITDSVSRSNTKTLGNYIAVSSPSSGPVVDFSASPLSGKVSINVKFTNLTTGSVAKWNWDFGDGQSAITKSPTHTYSTAGTYTVSLSATGSGTTNTVTKNNYITVTACPCSLWPATAVPANPSDNDSSPVELGVRFTSNVAGYITGIRFYKGAGNTGTHTASLWNSSGKLLKNVTFTKESTSGWQQVTFTPRVAITANTVYVASYHTNTGHYAGDNYYFSSDVYTPPLRAPANGNGVYLYGTGGFPTNTYRSSNYWVDIVFVSN